MRSKLLVAALFLVAFFSFGQTTEKLSNVNVSTTKAIHLGKTQPIKELIKIRSTDRDKKAETKRRITAAPENFIGRSGSNATRPELEHQGVDPIRQRADFKGRIVSTIEPSINIDGLASSFGSPNDPTGDVGLNYYVQAINATDIAVYDKTDGTLIDEFAANTLWTTINESSAGDPIILFDHEYNRWIITEFTHPSGTANLLFAISETCDPLGSYNVYAFSPPSFPDYPKWAIWSNTYMVTTNEGGPGALHQYFFDRAAFLAGDSEVIMQRVEIAGNTSTEAGFYVTTPVNWIGDDAPKDDNPIAVKINDSSWGEVANDAIEVFTFDVDFENGTTVTKTTIETTPFDGYPCDNTNPEDYSCLSQGGSSQGIDGIPEVIMNLPHYRNFDTHESIVLSFITDVDDGNNLSGIRWVELRRTTGDWGLYQEGTYAPDDGLHRFMPSISMDKDGNIGLGYNTTSDSEFVGIKFTGRYAEDALGTMTVPEYDVVSGTGSVSGDRFGDYAQMAIDPQDERTFWYTSEYAATSGSKTRIVAFQLESNAEDLTVVSIDEPNTSNGLSATETVTATIKNIGTNSVSSFNLILKLDGEIKETYLDSPPLVSGATLQHDFTTTLDLSMLGDYVIAVEVDYASDEVSGNNAMAKIVSNLAGNDASVTASASESTCEDNIEVDIEIINKGGITLESADIEIYLNEVLEETINWTGALETGKSANETTTLSGLSVASNSITVVVSNPNGETDEVPDDNTALLNVTLTEGMDQVTLVINADQYPDETTWELLDDEQNTVASGGPYSESQAEATIEEVLCVDPNACYEFVINDAYDDGICCEYGNGSYFIEDSSGTMIFAGNGQFGSSESSAFCIGQECNLAVSVTSQNANFQSGGTIYINASGSYGYEYSIDNGVTFQESAVFDELESGSYEVAVRSQSGGCSYTESVTIDYILNVSEDQRVKIAPNPTEGVFKISVPGHEYVKGFLEVSVIDMNGQTIQNHRFNRYDKVFEGTISLYAYPDGIYFLKLMNAKTNKVVKIIKQ